MFARLTVCLALVLAVAGCARLTGQDQISLCGAALALIEGDTVQLRDIRTEPATNSISIAYTASSENFPRADRRIKCDFAGSGFSKKRLELSSIETGPVKLGEASLIFLKRLIERQEPLSILDNRANAPLFRLGPEFRPLAYWVQVLIDAFPRASLYALLATSFSLIGGLVGRMMFGIGEIALIGAAAASLIFAYLVEVDFNSLLLGTLLLLCVAIWAGLVFGLTATRHIVEPLLKKDSKHVLIASCGLMIAIPEFIRLAQGNGFHSILPTYAAPIPVLATDGFVAMLNPMVVLVSLIAIVLMGGIAFVTKFSNFGRNWAAYAEDPDLAELIGIDRKALLVQTSAFSVGIAGACGALIVLLYGGPDYSTGTMLGIKALMAALIGRTRSVNTAIAAGSAIGLLEATFSIFLTSETLEPMIYAALATLLILRAKR